MAAAADAAATAASCQCVCVCVSVIVVSRARAAMRVLGGSSFQYVLLNSLWRYSLCAFLFPSFFAPNVFMSRSFAVVADSANLSCTSTAFGLTNDPNG